MRLATLSYERNGRMAAFDASLKHYLRIRTPERSRELLDFITWRIVGGRSLNDMSGKLARVTLDMPILLHVIDRIGMDQALWDFVGIVLFIAAVFRVNVIPGYASVCAVDIARAISDRVLSVLIDRSFEHGTRLTWDRVRDLASEWVRSSSPMIRIGYASDVRSPTKACLDRWMQAVQPRADVQRAWDSAIHRRMQRNAYDAQNELRRDRRIADDLVGLIAQFLAPPNTTQAQLKRQREVYASTIQIARLCVQARAPGLSFDAARDLQHQADLARGALLGQPPGVAVQQTLLHLHPMPTTSARVRDEGERHPKRQRTSESPI